MFKELHQGIRDGQKAAANRKIQNFNLPVRKSIASPGIATAMFKESVAGHRIFPSSIEEIKHSKELDRGIKDENKKAANWKVENFNDPIQKIIGTVDKESFAGYKIFQSSTIAPQSRIGGMERPADKLHNSTPKRDEEMACAYVIWKERDATDKFVPVLSSSGQRGNGGVLLPMENSAGSIHPRSKGSSHATSVEIDDYKSNKIAIISNNSVQRRTNGMAQSAQSLFVQKKINPVGLTIEMEGRAETNKSVTDKDHIVARNDRMVRPVEKDADNGYQERKEKGTDARREEKSKAKDHEKKVNDKNTHKVQGKEKVKVKEKIESDKERKEPIDGGKKNQLGGLGLNPLASEPHKANNSLIHENIKKRKENEKYGFLYDSNLRPNKVQNTNFSTPLQKENRRTLESSHIVFPSLKSEVVDKKLSSKAIDQEEHMMNGIAKAQPSSAGSMDLVAVETGRTSKIGSSP